LEWQKQAERKDIQREEKMSLTFSIDWEKDIVFKSEYARIEERDGALYCSLSGEFFEKEQQYKPPMTYEMGNIPVTTRDINIILRDKYAFLLMQDYPELAKKFFQKK